MQIRNFFENFYDAVFQHTRSLYWPSFVINIITSVVLLATLLPLVFNLFPQDLIDLMFQGAQDMETMKENSEKIGAYFEDNMAQFIGLYVGFLILMIILGAYSMLTGYTISKSALEGEQNWFSQIIRPNWAKMTKLMGLFALLIIMFFLTFVGSLAVGKIHILLWFVFMLFLIAVFMRFAISGPAIVIADMGITESLRYSWNKLSLGKGFKILFFGFVAMIATAIIAIIISLILGLIFGQGLSGQLISNAVLIFVNSAVFALYIAGSAGLLYRFGDFEHDTEVSLTEPEQPDMQ